MLWALEKIDPRLPKKVQKDYEHRLCDNTYPIDLQVKIFQAIPTRLEDLDKQVELSAMNAVKQEEVSLSLLQNIWTPRLSAPK